MNDEQGKEEDGGWQETTIIKLLPKTIHHEQASKQHGDAMATSESGNERGGGVSPHTAQLERGGGYRSPLSSGALDQKVRPGTGRLETFFPPGGRKQRSTVAGRSQALVQCCSRRSLCIVFIPRRTLLQFCILAAKGARPHRSSFRNRFTSAVLQCQC
jgi:hypothetical protein